MQKRYIYYLYAFSKFDYEIYELLGVYTTEEQAQKDKAKAIKKLDIYYQNEIIFDIKKIELNKLQTKEKAFF